jgi:hypothetical protein
MYKDCRGVSQDFKEAARWLRKSAEQGYSLAQHNLGVLYLNGEGVAQDYKEAACMFRKGANQGNPSAQCKLGVLYLNGQGVARDYKKAARWIQKAAVKGIPVRRALLGSCTEMATELFKPTRKQSGGCRKLQTKNTKHLRCERHFDKRIERILTEYKPM